MGLNKQQFVEGDTITNGIEDITRPRNFARGYSTHWSGDAWYWLEFSEDGTNIYLKIYSAPTLSSTKYLEHTNTITMYYVDSNGGYLQDIILRAWGDDIAYSCSYYFYNTNTSKYQMDIEGGYTTDGGTWYDKIVSSSNQNSVGHSIMVDIVQYSANHMELIYCDDYSTSNDFLGVFGLDSTPKNAWTDIYSKDAIYSGSWVEGTDHYQLVYKDTGGNWRTIYWDYSADTWTNGSIFTITEPSSFDVAKQQYAIQSGVELLMDVDYFRIRFPNETAWTKYTAASSTSAILVIWEEDFTRINYIIWDTKIWEWTKGGSIEKIQEYSGSTSVGMIDWFLDGSEVWEIDYVATYLIKGSITNRIMNYPTAKITSMTEPFTNQWLKLYNESDELIYQGRIEKDRNDGTSYIYTMRSGINDDFKRKITESYTAKTIDYIIKDIIDKYFSHIWYGSNISTSNTDTFTKNFKSVGFKDVLKWAAQYAGFVGSFTPDYELRLGDFIASGDIIADNVSTYGYAEKSYNKFHEKFSLVRIYGGYLSGVRLEATAVGEPNYGYWQDTFAHITSQTELDDLASQILADRNVEITAARFDIVGKDRILVGESFTYTSTRRSVSAETWYFIENTYNIKTGAQQIYATDSFWLPHPTKEERTDDRITQNEQSIGQNAADIETLSSAGGETNTASNVGTDGVGVYDGKVDVDLQFRNIAPASTKISTTLNGNDIDIDVVEANISHANIGGVTASQHHTKYTNAEAVSAVEGETTLNLSGTTKLGTQLNINLKPIIIYKSHSLGAGKWVYINSSGVVTNADSDSSNLILYPCIGVTTANNYIAIAGIYTTSGLSTGRAYYVSSTAGSITTAVTGTYIQKVGVAISSTQILITPNMDVLTNT